MTESFPIYWHTPRIHIVEIARLSIKFTIEACEAPTTSDTTGDTMTTTTTTLMIDVTLVEIAGGESIATQVMSTNTSSNEESCHVSLTKVNIRVDTKEVTVDGDASQQVIFTTLQDTSTSYTVEITRPTGIFTIEDMPPSIPESTESKPTANLNW